MINVVSFVTFTVIIFVVVTVIYHCHRRDLRSFEILLSVQQSFLTDASEQPICPFFNGKDWPETSLRNQHYTLRNIAEERRSILFRDGSLEPSPFTTVFIKTIVIIITVIVIIIIIVKIVIIITICNLKFILHNVAKFINWLNPVYVIKTRSQIQSNIILAFSVYPLHFSFYISVIK